MAGNLRGGTDLERQYRRKSAHNPRVREEELFGSRRSLPEMPEGLAELSEGVGAKKVCEDTDGHGYESIGATREMLAGLNGLRDPLTARDHLSGRIQLGEPTASGRQVAPGLVHSARMSVQAQGVPIANALRATARGKQHRSGDEQDE